MIDLMLQFLKEASQGARILIIGEHVLVGSYTIGQGAIFVRQWRPTGLKSVAVDTLVFLDDAPEEIRLLALAKTQGQPTRCRFFEPWKDKQ